ncbi:uncharacterized protein ACBT44_008672 [Syngnathus typhle]
MVEPSEEARQDSEANGASSRGMWLGRMRGFIPSSYRTEVILLLKLAGPVKQPTRLVSVRGARLVPLSVVYLKQDEAVVRVAVWREATLTPIKVGASYTFTHLSAVTNDFGLSLNTTQHSKISGYNTTVSLVAIGLLMEDEEVKLLDGEGVETAIAMNVWTKTFVEPPTLPEEGLPLNLIYSEGQVVEICK